MASQGVFCPCFVIQEGDRSPLPESAPHSLPQPWQTGPASLLRSPGPCSILTCITSGRGRLPCDSKDRAA